MSDALEAAVTRYLRARARFGPFEIAFWIAGFATMAAGQPGLVSRASAEP